MQCWVDLALVILNHFVHSTNTDQSHPSKKDLLVIAMVGAKRDSSFTCVMRHMMLLWRHEWQPNQTHLFAPTSTEMKLQPKKKLSEGRLTFEFTHLDCVPFAEETGIDTLQKKDGHSDGEKCLTDRGHVPKSRCTTADVPCTLLPFTAGIGEPMLSVATFEGEGDKVPASWLRGIGQTVMPVVDEKGNIRVDESNFGKGKHFPNALTVERTCQRNALCLATEGSQQKCWFKF